MAEIWAAGMDCKPGFALSVDLGCGKCHPQPHLISMITIKQKHVRTMFLGAKSTSLCHRHRKSLGKQTTILADCDQAPGFLDPFQRR